MGTKKRILSNEAVAAEMQLNTRRLFLKHAGLSLGAMALGSLTGCNDKTIPHHELELFDSLNPLSPKAPHFPAKAKSVIYLHMAGAPSQLELFDYKPELKKLHGQACPPSFLEGKKFAFIRGVPKMLGPQANFRQQGESGNWVSDKMPHLASITDELCFLKGIHTDQFNHAPAQMLMHTGSPRLGRPSIGSWVTYGLGSENDNLPGFVVLTSGGNNPDAGKQVWGSGFLPSVYQGVQCRTQGDPVLYLGNPKGISRDNRKASIEAINKINQITHDEVKSPKDERYVPLVFNRSYSLILIKLLFAPIFI